MTPIARALFEAAERVAAGESPYEVVWDSCHGARWQFMHLVRMSAYMSVRLWAGESPDHHFDLYSAACVAEAEGV